MKATKGGTTSRKPKQAPLPTASSSMSQSSNAWGPPQSHSRCSSSLDPSRIDPGDSFLVDAGSSTFNPSTWPGDPLAGIDTNMSGVWTGLADDPFSGATLDSITSGLTSESSGHAEFEPSVFANGHPRSMTFNGGTAQEDRPNSRAETMREDHGVCVSSVLSSSMLRLLESVTSPHCTQDRQNAPLHPSPDLLDFSSDGGEPSFNRILSVCHGTCICLLRHLREGCSRSNNADVLYASVVFSVLHWLRAAADLRDPLDGKSTCSDPSNHSAAAANGV